MSLCKLPAISAALALLAFATTLFFPALFQGKILAPLDITKTLLQPWADDAGGAKPHNHNPTDAVTQYLPYRIHAGKSLLEDGYIGWNPYEMGGYNMAANTMALPGTWTLQLHRFLPFKEAWNLGLLAEFLVAGSGMLVFLRSRNLPWLPCLIGALAYMANSQFIIWIYHRWALSSFCWMPWVLWSAAGAFNLKSLTLRQFLLPGFIALALLGASLQHMVFVGLACGCLLLGSITKPKSILKEWPLAAGWTCAFLLALGLSAFSIVPQIQGYLTNIQIGHTRGGMGYPEGSLQPAFNLLAIPAQIWPWLMGDPQSIDGWRLLKSYFMNLAYLGTIPMVLGICGLFFKGMPRQSKWLIAAGLFIPLTPLVGPLYHRAQLLFLLGAAWMTAEMLTRLPAHPPARLLKWWIGVGASIGAALLIGSCLPQGIRTNIENQVVAKSLQASKDSRFGGDSAWIEARARLWVSRFALHHPRTAWTYGLLVLGTAGLSFAASPHRTRQKWGNIAIMGSVSLELLTFFQTWTTFSKPEDLTPRHPAIERVRELAGAHRVSQSSESAAPNTAFAAPNLLAAFLIPSADAYESIQYRTTSWTLRHEDPAMRLTLAGVGISAQPAGILPAAGTVSWPVVEDSNRVTIRRNPDALPPLLAGSGPMPKAQDEVLPLLQRATPLTASESTMNHWSFRWPGDSDWIRISQNWHPGWRYRVQNGPWIAVLEGPDSSCWLPRPPRHHQAPIEVRFVPRPQGLVLASLGTVLVWLGFILVLRTFRSDCER